MGSMGLLVSMSELFSSCYIMELIEDFNILYDAQAEYVIKIRKKRVFRTRLNYFEVLDEIDFRSRFRLTKKAVIEVHEIIKDKICSKSTRNNAVPTIERLLLTLRYFATGSYLTSTGDFIGVSRSSACRFIKEVSEAITLLQTNYVRFPQDLAPLKQSFFDLARFPRVIGAIGCTHVAISSIGENAEVYRNRKGVLSMNVQVICDANLIIRDIVAQWPGSTHAQTIFNKSLIKVRFEAGQFDNSILLGDSGYQSESYLFTPLAQTNTPAESLYNEAHILSRNVVERCFGVLKSRFPILRKRVTLSLQRTAAIIVACGVLHNVAVRMNDEPFELEREQHPDMNRQEQNNDPAIDPRRQLILEYFTPLK